MPAAQPKKGGYHPALPLDPRAEVVEVDKLLAAKGPIPAKIADAETVQLLHRKAIALAMSGDIPKAREVMKRVVAQGLTSRTVVMNYAKLDILSKTDAVRGALTLDNYLRLQDLPDEDALMLMGVALNVAASNGHPLPPDRVNDYDRYKAALEAQQPGRRLWGTSWVSAAEYQKLMSQRDRAMENVRQAENVVTYAKRNLESARSSYSGGAVVSGRLRRPNPDNSDYVSREQDNLRQAERGLADARAKVPTPPWTASLKLAPPDALPGQTPAVGSVTGGGDASAAGAEVRVVFVVDTSGPMIRHFPDIRDEIVKAVARMDEQKMFRVILSGNDQATALHTKWTPGGEAAARDLAAAFDNQVRQTPSGDALAGIVAALQMRATTVWVASDGDLPDPAKALALLHSLNAGAHTKINTLTRYAALNNPASIRNLWQIAAENSGACYGIDGQPIPEPAAPGVPGQPVVPSRPIPKGPSVFDQ